MVFDSETVCVRNQLFVRISFAKGKNPFKHNATAKSG